MLSTAEMGFPRSIVIGVLALALCACGGLASQPTRGVAELETPGALADLLPTGADVVALIQPAALRAASPTRDMVESIAGPGFIESIRIRTGVDAMALEELVVGVYGDDLLIIARGPQSAADVVTVLGMRMSDTLSSAEDPARRVGFLNGSLWHAIAFSERVFAVAIGNGEELPAVHERVRLGQWPEGERGVVGSADVRRVMERVVDGPARIILPEPLGLPDNSPLGLILAQERALGLSLVPGQGASVGVELGIVGELPARSERNLRQWVTSMAEADLGRALGLQVGLDSLRVQANADQAWVRIELPTVHLCRGLRILFGAELQEITDGLIHDVAPQTDEAGGEEERRRPVFEGVGRGAVEPQEAPSSAEGGGDE